MMVGYDIDFATIIIHRLHERDFGDMAVLPFPYLIQMLGDKADMLEFPGVDASVEVTIVAQTSMIKDLTNLVLTQRAHRPLDSDSRPV